MLVNLGGLNNMKWQDIISESPMKTGDGELGFDNQNINNETFNYLMKQTVRESYFENDTYRWILTGVGSGGIIAVLNVKSKRVEFYSSFMKTKTILGKAIYQQNIWKDSQSLFIKDHNVVNISFDNLLELEGMMISDTIQTPRGNSYWMKQMKRHYPEYLIGYIASEESFTYEGSPSIEEWLTSNDTFGNGPAYKDKRLFIKKH